MKSIIAIFISFSLIIALFNYFPNIQISALTVEYNNAVAYQQADPPWGEHIWKNVGDKTIRESACGVFSLINAVNYKSKTFLDPINTADWANENGFGTTSGIGAGIGTGQFFDKASYEYGFTYVCATNSVSSMLTYVRNGNIACSCVPGHWIAIVDYDPATDMYLLLDSASSTDMTINPGKRTKYMLSSTYTIPEIGDDGLWTGVAWVKSNLFMESPAVGNYGLSNRPMAILSIPVQNCTCSDTSMIGRYIVNSPDGFTNVYEYESDSSDIITTIPDEAVVTVTKGTDSWYYIAEYDGHCDSSNLKRIDNSNLRYEVTTQSSNLNMRTVPKISGTIIASIPKGTEIIVLDTVEDNQWAMVYYSGMIGYCSMQYLTLKDNPPPIPTYAFLQINKPSIIVGESIEFSAESDYATNFTLFIEGDAIDNIEQDMPNGSLTLEFSVPGHYNAYIVACNSSGSIKSSIMEITVCNFAPSLTIIKGSKYQLTNCEWTSVSNAKSYSLKVWNGIADEEKSFIEINDIFSTAIEIALPDGYFEAYVEAICDTGNLKSNVVKFRIDEACILLKGDANGDGEVSVADAVMLQNWLLTKSKELTCWQNVDLCEDGRIDVFDLCLLKRMLVKKE